MPVGRFRLPGGSRDGLTRRRGNVLERLLHHQEEPVLVRSWIAAGSVRFQAEAPSRQACEYGIDRMRFALALDLDLAPFMRRFRRDPLVGPAIRQRQWYRPWRQPEPFESLAWAITEQLIEAGAAFEIQKRMIRRFGRRSECGRRSNSPTAAAIARRSPPEIQSCGLAERRAIALLCAAREVADGRIDLHSEEPEKDWARLRSIPNVGSWTIEKLAWHGQGRADMLPAGDLAYVKIVGVLAGLGRRATEDEVREYFAPYAPYQAIAGMYALRGAAPAAGRW
ncbi:MAG: DNA-3-methyladenine glycosylase 2 family protein [Thermoleophilaceae bacterium]|nr:DNA-3-methyladenine glycosylase 2 family protein [Thermoleophilaceae bacterium]